MYLETVGIIRITPAMTQPKFNINRELIESGGLRQAYHRLTKSEPWSDAQIDESIEQVVSAIPRKIGIWVFAYGSLLWNPCIHISHSRRATLYGRHRTLRLLSRFARGTIRRPGLLLTLAPGGCCHGLALRVAHQNAKRELTNLWRREMMTGSYRPRLFNVTTNDTTIPAIVFDGNLQRSNSCEPMPMADQLKVIRRASGFSGSNADYIVRTHRALSELGIRDTHLAALSAALGHCDGAATK
jgi:glutathione-specific gamma-glutamylcyclotransferase